MNSSFSKKELDRIGDSLIDENAPLREIWKAVGKVEQWRSSFSLPMRATSMVLKSAALQISPEVIVSSRLKRMEAIIAKLQRGAGAHGRLSTIQDIGGCRAVFPLIDHVGAFANASTMMLETEYCSIRNNYILNPKDNGYRSIHVVSRYKANNPRYSPWDGRKIEIQIRTQIQHSWATALETVDLFSNQGLKWGSGDQKWQRFFVLASALFAREEGTPPVPNTPKSRDTLREELRSLWIDLDALPKLAGWSRAVSSSADVLNQKHVPPNTSTFLVVMDVSAQELRITPYLNEQMDVANSDYAHYERLIRNGYRAYAVLVSVADVEMLRKAYPNFYADTDRFVLAVRTFLGEERGINFGPLQPLPPRE